MRFEIGDIYLRGKYNSDFSTLVKARRYIYRNVESKDLPIVITKIDSKGNEEIAGYMKNGPVGTKIFYIWSDGWKWIVNKDGTLGKRF